MLGEIQKPVIVTGSQIPISQIRSDAISNVLNSLIFACNDMIKEVCIYFNQRLLRGNRATKISATSFDAFLSPNYPTLAHVGTNIGLKEERLWRRSQNSKLPKLESTRVPKIAILSIFPGMDNDILKTVLEPPLQGLILKTYGTGNMTDDPDIYTTLARADDRGVVIINCTQCVYGGVQTGTYKIAQKLIEIGVVSGWDMTDEAALGKLFYLLSQPKLSQEQIKQSFEISLQGEVTINDFEI